MSSSVPLASSRPSSRVRREWRDWLLFVAFIGPNLALFTIFTFWPLLFNAYLSFTFWDLISPVKIFIGLENYQEMFVDRDFHRILVNTFVLMGGAVVATLLLGLALALLLNQPLFGRNVARSTLFAPTVLSGSAIAVVWVYIFDPNYGLGRTLLAPLGLISPNWLRDPQWAMVAVIIVYVWKNLGYAFVIFLAGLQAIPRELYEAALVDGAGPWARFRHVTVPGLSPITFFLMVTSILATFQAFDIIKVLTQGGPVDATNTLIYYLYEQGFVAFNAGRAGVAAVTLFVLMFAVTVLQVRYGEKLVNYG